DRQVVGGGELAQGLALAGDKRAVGDRHARQRGQDIGRRDQRREGRAGHAGRRGGVRDKQQPRRERAQGLHRQQRRRRAGDDDRAAGVGRIQILDRGEPSSEGRIGLRILPKRGHRRKQRQRVARKSGPV